LTGAELRAARLMMDLSQQQLGDLLGQTGNTTSRLERGVGRIKRLTELAVEQLTTLSPEARASRLRNANRSTV
jgi:transcriptional regulator with XRE-family HTH domain